LTCGAVLYSRATIYFIEIKEEKIQPGNITSTLHNITAMLALIARVLEYDILFESKNITLEMLTQFLLTDRLSLGNKQFCVLKCWRKRIKNTSGKDPLAAGSFFVFHRCI
jgi:hypothetical protein